MFALLTRHPEKSAALAAQGAIVQPISSDNAQGLIEITQQADALFWLTPPKLDAPNLRDWYVQTAKVGANAVDAGSIVDKEVRWISTHLMRNLSPKKYDRLKLPHSNIMTSNLSD